MKTKEELKQLKETCETLNNKLKELTEEELQFVIGGAVGVDGYKYSFRYTDWVHLSNMRTEQFFVRADIDTNDDDYSITGEVHLSNVREKVHRKKTMRVKDIYKCYIEHGGKLHAMQ